jgi:hypothetical protein
MHPQQFLVTFGVAVVLLGSGCQGDDPQQGTPECRATTIQVKMAQAERDEAKEEATTCQNLLGTCPSDLEMQTNAMATIKGQLDTLKTQTAMDLTYAQTNCKRIRAYDGKKFKCEAASPPTIGTLGYVVDSTAFGGCRHALDPYWGPKETSSLDLTFVTEEIAGNLILVMYGRVHGEPTDSFVRCVLQ